MRLYGYAKSMQGLEHIICDFAADEIGEFTLCDQMDPEIREGFRELRCRLNPRSARATD
jgi:hypothetical protein